MIPFSFLKAIFSAALILTFSGCTRLVFEVAARSDPFSSVSMGPSTYSFRSDTLNRDPVIERKLQYLIDTTLRGKGWKKSGIEDASFVFSVEFGMDTKQETNSHRTGDYNIKTKKWENVTQQVETDTYYSRSVKIICFVNDGDKQAIWSADCTSDGSTRDVLYAASRMVPYAMSKFPQEGIWRESVRP